MATPGITYRSQTGNTPLTHTQMDNNFRSLVYSSSIHDNGDYLRLHYDVQGGHYDEIALNAGSGGITVNGNVDNRILTATGNADIQGENNFTFDGSALTLTGTFSINDGEENIIIGASAGGSITSGENTIIGHQAGLDLTSGIYNTVLGHTALVSATTATRTVALGNSSLESLVTGVCNVGIGYLAGSNLANGSGNIYIGDSAGPTTAVEQYNKLYINNSVSDTPLILGDFSTGHVTINSTVSASVFSGSYYGDGSNLTGVTATAEWDGSIDGDVSITGSLIVSGSDVTVDFTNVESISGSIFSGSFVGDGSLLTGITAEAFPYTGSAIISGSLLVENSTILSGSTTVSGSFTVHGPSDLNGVVTADQNITITNGNTDGFNSTNTGVGRDTLLNGGIQTLANGIVRYSCQNVALGHYTLSGKRFSSYDNTAGTYNQDTSTNFCNNTAIGYQSQQINIGNSNTSLGYKALFYGGIGSNVAIGAQAMLGPNRRGIRNTAVGTLSLHIIDCGYDNTALGVYSLKKLNKGNRNVSIGACSLYNIKATTTGTGATIQYDDVPGYNTAVGASAGFNNTNGSYNVYIGHLAGPSSPTSETAKLYINYTSGTPLIGGDFSTRVVTIDNCLKVAQASGSFIGNGSGLTGVTGEWDGSRNGDGEITGSFTVSGSDVTVDFTNTLSISGSTFSGSFVGDGSGLTGITAGEWDGTRNGDANITGSLIVSGALDVSSTITLGSTGYPGSPGVELIHFHSSSLSGTHTIFDFAIGGSGYTGFKADYTLNTESEDEKKVGTLLGAWDQSSGTTINDSHTTATGNILGTSFSIDSDGSNALLKLDASTGTYNVNMLITAFKRQV